MLKFYARDPHVVHHPGLKATGQLAQYIGRRFNFETRQHEAVPEGECLAEGTPDALRACKAVLRDGALWPADEATAAACGVPFVRVELVDGSFRPVTEGARASALPSASESKAKGGAKGAPATES